MLTVMLIGGSGTKIVSDSENSNNGNQMMKISRKRIRPPRPYLTIACLFWPRAVGKILLTQIKTALNSRLRRKCINKIKQHNNIY